VGSIKPRSLSVNAQVAKVNGNYLSRGLVYLILGVSRVV